MQLNAKLEIYYELISNDGLQICYLIRKDLNINLPKTDFFANS